MIDTSSAVVTALRPDRRTPGCLVVEVDGERFATLPAEVITGLELDVGEPLSSDAWDRLREAANLEAACRVAVRLLAARARSEWELRRSLAQRGHDRQAVDGAIAQLRDRGHVDDAAFADLFARSRLTRGHGAFRVVSDLRRRGVDGALATRTVDAVSRELGVDAGDQLRTLVEKRHGQLAGLSPTVRRRRLLAFLGRRGFRGHEAIEAVDEVVGDAG